METVTVHEITLFSCCNVGLLEGPRNIHLGLFLMPPPNQYSLFSAENLHHGSQAASGPSSMACRFSSTVQLELFCLHEWVCWIIAPSVVCLAAEVSGLCWNPSSAALTQARSSALWHTHCLAYTPIPGEHVFQPALSTFESCVELLLTLIKL